MVQFSFSFALIHWFVSTCFCILHDRLFQSLINRLFVVPRTLRSCLALTATALSVDHFLVQTKLSSLSIRCRRESGLLFFLSFIILKWPLYPSFRNLLHQKITKLFIFFTTGSMLPYSLAFISENSRFRLHSLFILDPIMFSWRISLGRPLKSSFLRSISLIYVAYLPISSSNFARPDIVL